MRGLLAELRWRGLLQDATPGLEARLASGTPITGYIGFDPTAPSLQVGNLVPVMLLAHLQRAGGTPIVLMGGGTGMIGDPSGKQTERPLLTAEQVDQNIHTQQRQFEGFFKFGDSPNAARMVNNSEWLRSIKLVDFLRDTGKHFTLSHMLQKESVKARMEGGISYTEFSYMLLQAYDFLQLRRGQVDIDGHKMPPCELQMGGSDQWGNITAGIELIRRADGADAHGLCAPLLTTATGSKFGKTEGKSVWLDPVQTPPVVFYNFWVNIDDRDIEGLLKRFTFKSREEITALMERHAGDPGARIPHHALALDVTAHVHGQDVANDMANAVREIHSQVGAPEFNAIIEADITKPIDYTWNASQRPKYEDLFVAATLASSKSDARRQITGKGLYVLAGGGWSVPEAAGLVTDDAITAAPTGSYILLRKGKKASGIKILKLA